MGLICLYRIEKNHVYKLQDFQDRQVEWLSEIDARLFRFREHIKELVRNAVRLVLS